MGYHQWWVSGILLFNLPKLYSHAEPFNDNGTYREDVFYNTLNTSYIPLALKAARSADPNAKLYINEYNIEYTGACTPYAST